ncbi:conjugal transfer pilus assembly protein TraB, partial [Salmonella enterica subsp. enterica serovar Enteritidis str. 629163]
SVSRQPYERLNTDQMLKQLGDLNPQQFMSGSQGGHANGK